MKMSIAQHQNLKPAPSPGLFWLHRDGIGTVWLVDQRPCSCEQTNGTNTMGGCWLKIFHPCFFEMLWYQDRHLNFPSRKLTASLAPENRWLEYDCCLFWDFAYFFRGGRVFLGIFHLNTFFLNGLVFSPVFHFKKIHPREKNWLGGGFK